ncbi:MAG: hypothetical protein J6Y44_01725 [Clostridia bacterium]|nr:hypothetical protein [Clostridia bacterium]
MEKQTNSFEEDLVKAVKEDFENRRNERRTLEQQWNLNLNYLMGNQYCEISPTGAVEEEDGGFYWQNKNVYNHIAPIIETRLAKLSRVRPIMSVRASGSEDEDLKTAKISADVLNSTASRVDLDKVIASATLWSEALGTSFYKIMWNGESGRTVGELDGERVFEGDVDIIAVSPYEIFPDSLFREDLSKVKSLIHARAMSAFDVEQIYGVKVDGEDIDVFSLDKSRINAVGGNRITSSPARDSVIVIERFELPNKDYPNGRVVTIAGDKLLSVSELPYLNGVDGERDLPFVKQDAIAVPGSFFGVSVINRLIPLQRAYNAVKNRKHEFMNRVSVGVLTVEEGSVDTDALSEEGLQPGKIIVYRQGSTPPREMAAQSVPLDFTYEEERLSNEFITISGVSEISRNSAIPANVTSGVALQVLVEQDDTRLSSTAENVRKAIKEVAKHVIRLFRQFASKLRMMKIAGDNKKVEVFYFSSSDLTSDDVVFDTENELSYTPAQKRSMVMELLSSGLLSDKDGSMSPRTKAKVLEILGYGSLDNAQDLTDLHIARADEENLRFKDEICPVEEFDDHETHIVEHTRFLLSDEASGEKNLAAKNNAILHVRMHRQAIDN